LEEILGILEARLQSVKLVFQFYVFGEETTVGNFIYLGKKEQNLQIN